ncbi:GGDEF domain-containing protein [Sphingomonas oryzagri]
MRLPRSRAQIILGLSLLVTVAADFATGPDVNLHVFYLAIACFGSWCLGERTGLAVGVIAVLMLAANRGFGFGEHVSHAQRATLFWNMLARCLTSIIMVATASGLRHSLDEARWSATTDALTGVLNKAAFQRRLGALVRHAQRRGDSLVLAYIDLDGFKGVNDGFGHAAGDRLLCDFSEQASDAIRAHDLFARIGGDEFVTLMTVPNGPQGDIAAERLHHRLSVILRGTGHAVTCSMGAMVVPAQAVVDTTTLVEAADALMYEVKRGGKNALRVARLDLQTTSTGQVVLPLRPDRRKDQSKMADAA